MTTKAWSALALIPLGVPGLFQQVFAPADTMQFVKTKGLPVYSLMRPERQTSSMAVVEVQSNPLTLCTRPLALRKMTKTS